MFRKQFDFSGVRICIRCEHELESTPALDLFAVSCTDCDCVIDVEFVPALPAMEQYFYDGNTEVYCKKCNLGADRSDVEAICTRFTPGHCRMSVIKDYEDGFDLQSVLRHAPVHHILLGYDALVLHASYILFDGEAILFSAPCGTGKSTQARLWQTHRNAQIVNGDRVLLRLNRQSGVLTAGGIYYAGTSGICKNVTAPVRAVVLLGQASENSLTKSGGGEAMRRLFREMTYIGTIGDDNIRCAQLTADMLCAAEVLQLDCTPDERAVCALYDYLYGGK